MGLLDEAIRDHLELKRRRGADPVEVAREEHEALEPIFPDEPPHDGNAAAHAGLEHHDAAQADSPLDQGSFADAQPAMPEGEAPHQHDFSAVGQETAELDMQAFLDADAQMAESASNDLPEQIPGQERLSFE